MMLKLLWTLVQLRNQEFVVLSSSHKETNMRQKLNQKTTHTLYSKLILYLYS